MEVLSPLGVQFNDLYAITKTFDDTLRSDYLVEKLKELYGGEHINVVKKSVRFKGDTNVLEYLENLPCR